MKIRKAVLPAILLLVIPAAIRLCYRSSAAEIFPPPGFDGPPLRGAKFVIRYPSRLSGMASRVEEVCAGSIPTISSELGVESADTVRIYIAPNHEEYMRIVDGRVGEWSAAASFIHSQTMVLNADRVLRSPKPLGVVVQHELSHLFFSQRIGRVKCPTWFMEGVAMHQSREWSFVDQWNLALSVWRKELPYLDQLRGAFPPQSDRAAAAYLVSYAAFEELFGERPGDLVTFTAFIRETGDFDRAFFLVFGRTTYDFSIDLQLLLEERYAVAGGLISSFPYFAAMTVLFLAVYFIKRHKTRRKLREWEEEEVEYYSPY